MVYDEKLAERVRKTLASKAQFEEKRMFGGIAFMVRGNMCVGVLKNDLMVRVGPDAHEAALKRKGARVMDFTHRPMKGFLFVGPEGHRAPKDLEAWVDRCLAFVGTLPAK